MRSLGARVCAHLKAQEQGLQLFKFRFQSHQLCILCRKVLFEIRPDLGFMSLLLDDVLQSLLL